MDRWSNNPVLEVGAEQVESGGGGRGRRGDKQKVGQGTVRAQYVLCVESVVLMDLPCVE